MFTGSLFFLSLANCVLLPLLEAGSIIEVTHTLKHLNKLLTCTFLQGKHTFNCVPDLFHFYHAIICNYLLVAPTQHQSELGAQEPLLHSLLAIKVRNILFVNFLFNSEGFQELCHFLKGQIDISQIFLGDNMLSSLVLLLNNAANFLGMRLFCCIKAHLSLILFLDTNLERIESPSRKSLLQIAMLRHVKKVDADPLSILVQIVLAGNHSDPPEYLNPECASRNSTYHINCVLFSADIVTPSVQNVPALLNVNIVLDAGTVRIKGFVKLTLHTITLIDRFPQLIL
jgi:hypothetical protein